MEARLRRKREAYGSPPRPEGPVQVEVCRITGKQLFFNIGRSACEECDLAVAAVRKAIAGLGGIPVRLEVEAWLNRLPFALARGAHHPPITLVDGRIISQGVVPDVDEVRIAILKAAEQRKGGNCRLRSAKQPGPEAPSTINTQSSTAGVPT